MANYSIRLDKPVEFVDTQPLESNPMISKTKVKIAYAEENRNGSYIGKDVMTDMARRSLRGTPIVGYYSRSTQDFDDHGVRTRMNENGEIEEVRITQPYGFVPDNAEVYWETYQDEDGTTKQYLCSEAYLWTGRYPEALRVLEGENNQSMELDPNTVKGDWAKSPTSGREVFVFKEANFTALCILGADIEPAFEGASFVADYSKQDNSLQRALSELAREEYEREMATFKKGLEFALKHEFNEDNVPVKVVEVDTEEQLEGVEHAVNELDEAAEKELNPESQRAIDSAIDTLLDVEQKLDIESQVVAKDEEGQEVLDKMAGDTTDILSSPEYAQTITTPFEEEEEMPVDKNKEVILGTDNAEKDEEEVAVTTTEETTVVEEPAAAPVVEEEPVQEEGRQSADEKRKEVELAKFDDEELLEHLIQRMETAENMKARVQELVAGEDVTEGEEDKEEFAKEDEEKENTEEGKELPPAKEEEDKEDFAELGGITQDRKEEGASKATAALPDGNTTPDVEGAGVDGEPGPTTVDVKTAGVNGTAAPAGAPEGAVNNPGVVKGKKDIQTYELEVADLSKQLIAKTNEFQAIEKELEELREFKANIENSEKEAMLKSFSLLDEETVNEIRADFSKLTVEDVESKCAVAYYRKGLVGKAGQNSPAEEGVVSYNLEGADSTPGWIKALKNQK